MFLCLLWLPGCLPHFLIQVCLIALSWQSKTLKTARKIFIFTNVMVIRRLNWICQYSVHYSEVSNSNIHTSPIVPLYFISTHSAGYCASFMRGHIIRSEGTFFWDFTSPFCSNCVVLHIYVFCSRLLVSESCGLAHHRLNVDNFFSDAHGSLKL